MAKQYQALQYRPNMRTLTDEQMRRIHGATMDVLENTGVEMAHDKALEYMDGLGCRVDKTRVRIPSYLVEKALATAPSRLTLYDRDGRPAFTLDGNDSFFGPSLDCMDYLSPADNQRVPFTSEHCKQTATLADHLENYDWVMTIGMASDQPAAIADRVIAKQVFENCTKPYVFCCNDLASEKAIYEMAVAIRGSKENFEKAPNIVQYSEPISPLTYYGPAVEKIMYSAEHMVPLINFPAPQCCGTAPPTFAGTMVQASAESLSGLVLHQAVQEGAPFVYGAFTTIMDQKTTIFSYGAVEVAIMCGGMAQMAQFYQLPFFGTAGSTDAKVNDPQAGIEASIQTLTAAAIGSGLVHDCAAWLDHGSLVSPAYMVMVNEILHMVRQFMKGIEVSEETLCVDMINRIGPGGNYLMEEETLSRFKDVFYSDIFDRTIYDVWKETGEKTFEDRLREKTLSLMQEKPALLPENTKKTLDDMEETWKKAL